MGIKDKMLNRMKDRLDKKFNLENVDTLKTIKYLRKNKSVWPYKDTIFKALQYRYNEDIDIVIADILESKNMGTAVTLEKMIKTYGEIYGPILYKETCKNTAVTLENMIKKYGEIEGNKRWDNYRKKQAHSNTYEYKKEKHGWTKHEFKEYNSSRAVTLKNMINKYGPSKGKEVFESYVEKQKYVGTSKQYFIDLYGEELGTNEYLRVNSEKALTHDNFIRKYGSPLGEIKFKEFIEQRYNGYSSPSATKFFNELINYLGIEAKSVYYGDTKEFALMDIDKSYYFYDFKIKGTNKIIEYHGNYWHANPLLYAYDELIQYPNKTEYAMNIWENDIKKMNCAVSNRYDIMYVWEHDINSNLENILKNVQEFIYEV